MGPARSQIRATLGVITTSELKAQLNFTENETSFDVHAGRFCFWMMTPFRKEFLWFFQDRIQASKACEVADRRAVVERKRSDSVTSDIRMPEKCGVEGLWVFRELSKDLASMITSVDSTDTVWAWRSGTSDYLEGSCGYNGLRKTDDRIGTPKAQLADFIKNNPLSRPNRQPRGRDPFSADWTAYHHLSEPQLFSQEGLGQPPS